MKFFGLILLVLTATAVSAQGTKGGVARPNYALLGAGRARAPAPPPAVKGRPIQQYYEEVPEEPKAALLSTRRQRPTPAPAPAPAPAPIQAPAPAIRPVLRPAPSRSDIAAPIRSAPVVEEAHPAPEPYSFSYAVKDAESGVNLSREESQDASGNIVGFYHILDAEGRVRRVDYTAGAEGFKATIQSNEEGFYHLMDSDGRLRRVDYTAGPEGFKATIRSNEEGLVSGEAADAKYEIEEQTAQQKASAESWAQKARMNQQTQQQRQKQIQTSGAMRSFNDESSQQGSDYALAGNRRSRPTTNVASGVGYDEQQQKKTSEEVEQSYSPVLAPSPASVSQPPVPGLSSQAPKRPSYASSQGIKQRPHSRAPAGSIRPILPPLPTSSVKMGPRPMKIEQQQEQQQEQQPQPQTQQQQDKEIMPIEEDDVQLQEQTPQQFEQQRGFDEEDTQQQQSALMKRHAIPDINFFLPRAYRS